MKGRQGPGADDRREDHDEDRREDHGPAAPGTDPDRTGARREGEADRPEWAALDGVRDAAIGISRVGPRKPDTLRGRERRNKRERDRRAEDRERGLRTEDKAVSDIQKMLAVADDPHTYELAARLPQPAPAGAGRPRCYPPWVWMLTGAGIEVYGNAKNAVTQLRGPVLWPELLDRARAVVGRDEMRPLRDQGPPDRHHWTYLARLWAADRDLRDAFHEEFRRTAVEKALAQGRLDPAAPFSLTDPDLDHYVHMDGVVLGSPSRALQPFTTDPETGEVLHVRYDTARGLWWQGGVGNQAAHGSHFCLMWNRSGRYGSRLLMDARHQAHGHPGGEGAMLLAMFRDLVAAAPGVQGVLTDGIWHDKHLRQVFDMGRVAVSPVAAARSGKGWREPRSHALPDAEHLTPSGTCRHTLVARDGAVCHKPKQNRYAGGLQELEVVARERRPGVARTTWYLVVRVPCARAPGAHFDWRVGLAHHAKDEPEFARQEYLRLYAPGSDLYARTYFRRVDAESGNRAVKRPFPDDRIPAWAPERQLLVMLMKAHTINAVSRHVHERDTTSRPSARGRAA